MTWLQDPQARDFLVALVTLYPAARILGRLGLRPAWAGLVMLSVIIPLAGHLLVALYAATRPWPALPVPPPPLSRRRSR